MDSRLSIVLFALLVPSSLGRGQGPAPAPSGQSCEEVEKELEEFIANSTPNPDLKMLLEWKFEREDCWNRKWPECGEGDQSPIDIDTQEVHYHAFPDLILSNANVSVDYGRMSNVYKAAEFRINDDLIPTLSGGPIAEGVTLTLMAMYMFVGETNCKGSAHSINGQKYAAELIMIFTENYCTRLKNLLYEPSTGQIVQLAFFIETQMHDNPYWQPLTQTYTRNKCGEMVPEDLAPFHFNALLDALPSTASWIDHYYTYDGTVYGPPCTKSKWIVFPDPIYVSDFQMELLRTIKDERGRPIHSVRSIKQRSCDVYATIGCSAREEVEKKKKNK